MIPNERMWLRLASAACALAIFAATSCSPTTRAALEMRLWPCLTDSEADLILPMLVTATDADPASKGKIPEETQLVQKSCHQRVYQRRGSEFTVVYYGGRFDAHTRPIGLRPSPEQAQACLNHALQDIHQLHFSDGDAIVNTYRERFAEHWDDPERGLAKWLDCSDKNGFAYYVSIATLLHETTHNLAKGDCLYVPDVKENTCFDFKDRSSLPRANVLLLGEFPTKDAAALSGLSLVQNTYQQAWKASAQTFPIELFDELNAYTITAETMTAALHTDGASIVSKDPKQNFILLPLFMVYTVKYLDAVKQEKPTLYQEDFAKGAQNREVIDLLLNRAENACKTWTEELEKVGMPENDVERSVWQQYLAMKPSIAS
ncbi:MAG: hypothetical protein ACLQAT_26100 [Candidatus Binataceae bacterium]